MQILQAGNKFKITFNYNETLIEKIKQIPGARFSRSMLESYWTIPTSSLAYAIQNRILNEGHLYPHAVTHINKNLYKDVEVEVKSDRLKVVGDLSTLYRFQNSIEALCSYEEKEEDKYVVKSLAETIYFKKNIMVIKFPKGLQQRIIGFLKTFNLKSLKIHTEEIPQLNKLDINIHNRTPRSYQKEAYIKIMNKEIPNRATLVMATGAGKTMLSAFITASLKVPTIFYVYSTDLLLQTAQVYEEVFQQEVGIIGGNKFTIRPITIASMQAVYSCYERQNKRWDKIKDFLKTVELMFVDEGHMLGAETIYTVATITDAYYSYALTATPYREDGKELFIEAATGPAIELISENRLVQEGYVLPVEIEIIPVKHYQTRKKNYRKLYDAEIIDHRDRHRAVINSVFRHQDKQRIILVKEIRHGKKLQDNLGCPFIHGSISKNERTRILSAFRNGEIDLLIASSILKQGVDLPEAEVLILAHGGTSVVELLQKIGRVRRPAPGKEKGIVVDFFDYIMPPNENDIFKKQAEKRLTLYDEKNFKTIWFH